MASASSRARPSAEPSNTGQPRVISIAIASAACEYVCEGDPARPCRVGCNQNPQHASRGRSSHAYNQQRVASPGRQTLTASCGPPAPTKATQVPQAHAPDQSPRFIQLGGTAPALGATGSRTMAHSDIMPSEPYSASDVPCARVTRTHCTKSYTTRSARKMYGVARAATPANTRGRTEKAGERDKGMTNWIRTQARAPTDTNTASDTEYTEAAYQLKCTAQNAIVRRRCLCSVPALVWATENRGGVARFDERAQCEGAGGCQNILEVRNTPVGNSCDTQRPHTYARRHNKMQSDCVLLVPF